MPFGLTNAPMAFQQFMNTIFVDMLDVFIVVYLDNILIYSSDKTQHKEHVHEVLWHLRKHRLYAKPEKCKFYSESIDYLGYQQMENMDWPGFEPGTSLIYTGCSNQLSYQSVVLRMWVHLIPELSTLTSLTPRL